MILVRLTFKDRKSKPVPGFQVRLRDSVKKMNWSSNAAEWSLARSDDRGRVVVRLLPAKHWARRVIDIVGTTDELVVDPGQVELTRDDGPVCDFDIAVYEGVTIQGTVTGPEGKPVAGAGVYLGTKKVYEDRKGYVGMGIDNAVTDKEGKYSIAHVPMGDYVMTVRMPSHDKRNLVHVERSILSARGKDAFEQNLAMVQGGAIEGWVYTAEGEKLAAAVDLKEEGAWFSPTYDKRHCSPHRDTSYRIGKIPPGTYELKVFPMAKRKDGKGFTRDWRLAQYVPKTIVTIEAGKTLKKDVHLSKEPVRRAAGEARTPGKKGGLGVRDEKLVPGPGDKEIDKVTSRVKDPHGKGVEWLIYEKKFVARKEGGRLRNFEEFLQARALDTISVRGLVPTRGKVWAATDNGAFCFDRASGSWIEYAVNRTHIGVPVDSVTVEDEENVVFTLTVDGAEKTYVYDARKSKWSER